MHALPRPRSPNCKFLPGRSSDRIGALRCEHAWRRDEAAESRGTVPGNASLRAAQPPRRYPQHGGNATDRGAWRAGRAGASVASGSDIIERQARHLARLLDDLLDVARLRGGKIALRPLRRVYVNERESGNKLFPKRPMAETIVQFVVGGTLLVFAVWWKLKELREGVSVFLPHQVSAWARFATQLCLGVIAIGAIIDPMISGTAIMEIHAPKEFPTTLDNLRVRVVPTGFSGTAGIRTVTSSFDQRGVAVVPVAFGILESRANIEVFDESRSSPPLARRNVYISPFIRRQLSILLVIL